MLWLFFVLSILILGEVGTADEFYLAWNLENGIKPTLQTGETEHADLERADMQHLLPTPKVTEGAAAALPVLWQITALPAEPTAPSGSFSCSWKSSPTHFSPNKWALLEREMNKSLLLHLDSNTFLKAAQAVLPLAGIGSWEAGLGWQPLHLAVLLQLENGCVLTQWLARGQTVA